MPKIAKELSAIEVKRLTEPKLYPVGTVPGLCLKISQAGAKSWILRTTIGTKRRDLGLGAYPSVTLSEAWSRARDAINEIRAGVDPISERKAKQAKVEWTFKRCAEEYIAGHRPGWKSAKHAQQWEKTLEAYAYPHFGDKHVRDVGKADVLAAIEKNWSTKNETMVRVRNRIELVLGWAMQRGYRPEGINPAAWRGVLDHALPPPRKVNKRKHHPAMPFKDLYSFVVRLKAVEGMSARALEFVVLTACRSGEARGALWSEIDLKGKIWNVPPERMKAGRAHRVPLADEVVKLLEALPRFERAPGEVDYVFPGLKKDKALSDMSLTACMRRMGLAFVPHGFRSTFSDWTAERTAYPAEVREMALAHAVGNETEAAYRRGDLLDKRRALMQDWARFVTTEPPTEGSNVTQLRA